MGSPTARDTASTGVKKISLGQVESHVDKFREWLHRSNGDTSGQTWVIRVSRGPHCRQARNGCGPPDVEVLTTKAHM